MTDIDAARPSLHLARCHSVEVPWVRRWLRNNLVDPERVIDAELVATELIANAIDHRGGAAAVRITVTPGRQVSIEVDDNTASTALTPGRSRLGRLRGNGLTIIDAVASWGVARAATGKTVWARLPL